MSPEAQSRASLNAYKARELERFVAEDGDDKGAVPDADCTSCSGSPENTFGSVQRKGMNKELKEHAQ